VRTRSIEADTHVEHVKHLIDFMDAAGSNALA
jgi:hypothetical protein